MSRKGHVSFGFASLFRLYGVVFLLCLAGLRAGWAVDALDVGFAQPNLDLLPYLAGLETDARSVQIKRPDSAPDSLEVMKLEALGDGPVFHWVAAGLRNGSAEARDLVIVVPDQGFIGSGLKWPRTPGRRIVASTAAGPIELSRLPVVGRDAFAFRLDAGQSAAVAFEIDKDKLPVATIWQRQAFDQQKDYLAFFRGALLGIAVLLTVATAALYGFRARPVFLAAAAFSLSSVGFMVLEAGHMPLLLRVVGLTMLDLAQARALVEGIMSASLLMLLVSMTELRRLFPIAGNVLAIIAGLLLAIPLYGLADPRVASGLARVVFALVALGGFAVILSLWHRGEAKTDTAVVPWAAILAWTFLAALCALSDSSNASLSPLLLAGLCAVLVVLGSTLAHYALSQGYLSRHFFREAGRRALALAGARAYVWDWQPEEGELHVSPEIERALGQPPGLLAEAGGEAFIELMHPSDRTSYLTAVTEAEASGRGTIEREFRLRHGDGEYRWFMLRARAMPGGGRRAARCIGTLTDVTIAKRSEERLLDDAVYDRVTGLPNRALFLDRLARALPGADDDHAFYVLLVDIDRFKIVNDALGHEAGDGLLNVIGRRLQSEAGPLDSVARLPGGQFAILFAEAKGIRDVVTFTERLHRSIARPIMLDAQEIFLTACIGVSQYREAGHSAEQLLKDAAIALYEAKRKGAGNIEVFHTSMRDDRAELVILEQELRRAIERDEIEVHYQPIARLSDMNLAGFEALVRWRHPALGLLAPESFVGLAEQTGMIRDIGKAVLNEAGRQLGIWQRAFRPQTPIFVAVNISSAQLIEAGLIDDVKQIIHREGLSRGALKIEVTESLVMEYPERAAQILERFRDMGVGIACDDFGTGYSSLSSLRRLPFDTLKVDRSFISGEAQDQRSSVILEAIIAMARALNLSVVAEGIEDQDQVDMLGILGCNYGQGYFIGKPITARQVTDALNGLPYASSSGRTDISWLWERAVKDPPPEVLNRPVSTASIREAVAAMTPPPPPPVVPDPAVQARKRRPPRPRAPDGVPFVVVDGDEPEADSTQRPAVAGEDMPADLPSGDTTSDVKAEPAEDLPMPEPAATDQGEGQDSPVESEESPPSPDPGAETLPDGQLEQAGKRRRRRRKKKPAPSGVPGVG
ncbi:MAG: EAL domain-containing protein [Hyphomicrobiales bacterium]